MVLAAQLKSIIKNVVSPRNLNQLKTVPNYFDVSLEYLLFNETRTPKNTSFDDLKNEISIGNYEVILRKVNIRGP